MERPSSDPVYSEGPQGYSPHWGRTLLKPKEPSPANAAGHQTQQPTYPVMQKQQQSPLARADKVIECLSLLYLLLLKKLDLDQIAFFEGIDDPLLPICRSAECLLKRTCQSRSAMSAFGGKADTGGLGSLLPN